MLACSLFLPAKQTSNKASKKTTKPIRKRALHTTADDTSPTPNALAEKASKRKIVDEDEEEPLFPHGRNPRTPEYVPHAPPAPSVPASKPPAKKARSDAPASLSNVARLRDGERVNLVVIVKHPGTIRKTNWGGSYRFVTVCDDSLTMVTLALWSDAASSFRIEEGGVLLIKDAVVKTYNGERQLESVGETTMMRDPGSKRGKVLRGWWDANRNAHFRRLYSVDAKPSSVDGFLKNASNKREGKVFATVRGRVEILPDSSLSYTACLEPRCGKKVRPNEGGDAMWCEGCQKDVSRYSNRYCLRVKVIDESGFAYMTAFDAVGEEMLGKSVDELLLLKVCYCLLYFILFYFY